MNSNLSNLLSSWTEATAKAKWGVQKVFHDTFVLAEQGKTKLTYGSDFGTDGSPCLVNTVGTMLKATGGKTGTGLPSQHFHEIVGLFDAINRELYNAGVNTEDRRVSPMAAEVFLHHFAPLKDAPVPEVPQTKITSEGMPYVEPTDEEMAASIANMFMVEAPADVTFNEDNVNDLIVNEIESAFAHVTNDSESEPPC